TLIDTLKGNSSYSKASKYEYVNDNLLSTLHLACEHGKDGKISSPISESLSNYMARQLIAEGVYFRNTYPAMYPHVQAIVQDIIAAHARASEPKKPAPSAEHDRGEALKAQSETTPSELALMTPDQWKKEEMRYAKEGVSEKKSAFASILNALNVSKRTGKSAELMSSALFSPIILSKKNAAGEYEAIKVTYKGFDTTTKSDKVEFSYGDKTFSDLASFVNYIAANADITSFSKSSNEALKAQAARLAPQKEAIKDISNTMEGKLRTLFNKEGKGTDVRGTVIRELKNAFDRSKENHSPYEINSNHALFGTNIFAMENAHMMLEYKGENGKDTTLFIQSFDAKTKKPTDKVEVSGGLDAFIAKLTEIAKANGKVDAEKPAAISATPAPLPDAAPQEEDRGSDTPADADAAYKTLDAEAGALYKTAMKNSKNTINDVPKNAPAWENYLIAEKKILALTEAKKEAPYYTSLLHVAQTEAKLGRLADAKPHLEEVIAFFISHPAVENGLKKKNLAIRVSSAILEYEEKNSKK
ncbi:MAG: hypothetical protein NTX63_03280, partial [Candidatus Peregrinibacteria bacterium]|nr:hypothetical protein [Candidatus Peregrinibacteria bacterium]